MNLNSTNTGDRGVALDETKERILDAAERLFAERGLDKVSVREITRQARVNLAAINYHFESKEKLIIAVFARRLTPLNKARLRLLDKVEKSCGDKPPRVEDLLNALIRPAIEQAVEQTLREKGEIPAHLILMGRCLSETEPGLQEWMKKELDPLVKRFDAAMSRAMPSMPREEIFWRMHFSMGAMYFMLQTMGKKLPAWLNIETDIQGQVELLMDFTAAGMRSPFKISK